MHGMLDCHSHKRVMSTLFCVSKGGAGVQGMTAIRKTSEKKIKAKIIPSFKSIGFYLYYWKKIFDICQEFVL